MLKAAGSILVIVSTTFYGMQRAFRLQEQYREMEYLEQLFYQIQSEIRYARNPLDEIMARVGTTAVQPYRTWLQELGKMLKRRDGAVFQELWKTSIETYLGASLLPEREICRLMGLGERMGLMDMEMQIKALELYLNQLSVSMRETREGMKSKVRLCHCLGVMGGMMIVILLL